LASPAVGQKQGQAVSSVKLYVFDCGRLKSGNPQPLLDRGITTTDMSVAAYLVVHPGGTLVWDTGVIADELVKPEGTTEARATVHKTLIGQLAEIGYKPGDITYLALSHNHYDHSANANEFCRRDVACAKSRARRNVSPNTSCQPKPSQPAL
jgi:glyoxylase-like metal-dependent hydrolase (beta-lactamase superfamily II)